jgi:hypothetical protein
MLGIPVGPMNGEFALQAFRRSLGRGWFGRRIVDLDPSSFLVHGLLEFLRRRRSGGSLLYASLSPG